MFVGWEGMMLYLNVTFERIVGGILFVAYNLLHVLSISRNVRIDRSRINRPNTLA